MYISSTYKSHPRIEGIKINGHISMAGVTSCHDVYRGMIAGRLIAVKDLGVYERENLVTAFKEILCANIFRLVDIYCPTLNLLMAKERVYLVMDYVSPEKWCYLQQNDFTSHDKKLIFNIIKVFVIDCFIQNSDRSRNNICIYRNNGKKRVMVTDHHRTFIPYTSIYDGFLIEFIKALNPSNKDISDSIHVINKTLQPSLIIEEVEKLKKNFMSNFEFNEFDYFFNEIIDSIQSPGISKIITTLLTEYPP
ncbi:hypothetical protein [Citrobacter portucalensis]|uniref:hypothetical protein n=1 Tax=Citrobacter portucalensis TaxID=1639133 RepID=UPI002B2341DF|nr:hypothetical protein [Citrobacter portucalensis]MEB0324586.1 hypothetical protein [Citrobacter portucalensis]MEB0356869.1 hypothetical protein [Citrobacter portucalensis]MEB0402189.1 hypothetical protein [Citrobacter portucalensis]UDQ99699.1 hypothetical protein LJX96_13130 [Citrobacter freundii]